jgi:hypothetical protein
MVAHPKAFGISLECQIWSQHLVEKGISVGFPEIADYEVRRELMRGNKLTSIHRLNEVIALNYFPLTTAAMRKAAEFWARARQQGRPTSPDLALDADMILAGQAACLAEDGWGCDSGIRWEEGRTWQGGAKAGRLRE